MDTENRFMKPSDENEGSGGENPPGTDETSGSRDDGLRSALLSLRSRVRSLMDGSRPESGERKTRRASAGDDAGIDISPDTAAELARIYDAFSSGSSAASGDEAGQSN